MQLRRALAVALLAPVAAQQAGKLNSEGAPRVSFRECRGNGACTTSQKSIVLDANWRWVHDSEGWQNCFKDGDWVEEYCPKDSMDGGAQCAKNCALEAVTSQEYRNTYGITEQDGGVNLKFVSETQYGSNYGSRVYLLDNPGKYKMFKLKNREFTVTIDSSQLECGLNGALYFVEMDQDGGKGKGSNKAGAAYGTGYCDAQCPHDIKFMDGEANSYNWQPENEPPVGHFGMCCPEMDIWEANKMSTAYTPHACTTPGAYKCEGTDCGDNDAGERYNGVCDKDGCDFNSYRMGEQDFYGDGAGFKIDSSKPVTVVTQFLTEDGTDSGDLSEIRRFYVQDGQVVPNSEATILGGGGHNSITDKFCAAQKEAFADPNDHDAKGGLKAMGEALERGMVLVMSLWDDSLVNMLWLDSSYPPNRPASMPGVARGPCPGGESSTTSYVRSNYPSASVTFKDISFGEIGSTFDSGRRLGEAFV